MGANSNQPPPTVLVFGASGRIGGAVVSRLLEPHPNNPQRVIAAVRRPDAAARLRAIGAEVRLIDLDSVEARGLDALLPTLDGIDRVLLLTGYHVNMMLHSKAVIDAAVASAVRQLVHVGVYARADTTIVHYGWHQMVEAYIQRCGVPFTFLQPNAFMQNLLMPVMVDPQRPGVLTHFTGRGRPSWIDTDDIADVAAEVLRNPGRHAGKVYPLATEAASMDDVAGLLTAVTGRLWSCEAKPPQEFFEAVTRFGADPVYMACVRNVLERTANGSLSEVSDVFDTVAQVCGHAPTTLRQFVEKHRSFFSPERGTKSLRSTIECDDTTGREMA